MAAASLLSRDVALEDEDAALQGAARLTPFMPRSRGAADGDGVSVARSASWWPIGTAASYAPVRSWSPRQAGGQPEWRRGSFSKANTALVVLAVVLVVLAFATPKVNRNAGFNLVWHGTADAISGIYESHAQEHMPRDHSSRHSHEDDRGDEAHGDDEEEFEDHHGRHHEDSASDDSHVAAGNPSKGFFNMVGGFFGGVAEEAALALHIVTQTSTTTTLTTTTTVTTTTRTTTTITTTTVTTTTITTTFTTTTTKLTSLFCWEVVRPEGYEPPLVRGQWENKASIFGCEDYAVYSNGGVLQVGPLASTEIILPKNETNMTMGNMSKAGTTTSSWLNTRLFIAAWDMVLKDGRWWNHEWTVKVDPDAVFFPHRLKVQLYNYYRAGDMNGPALLVMNCDRAWNGEPYSLKLFGSMEVVSRNALGMYHARAEECINELDWHGWGEDMFMQICLKMLGVGLVNGVSLLADDRCHAAPCTDTSKVLYHDFKDVQSYFDCWGQSHAKEVIEERAREERLKQEYEARLRR